MLVLRSFLRGIRLLMGLIFSDYSKFIIAGAGARHMPWYEEHREAVCGEAPVKEPRSLLKQCATLPEYARCYHWWENTVGFVEKGSAEFIAFLMSIL